MPGSCGRRPTPCPPGSPRATTTSCSVSATTPPTRTGLTTIPASTSTRTCPCSTTRSARRNETQHQRHRHRGQLRGHAASPPWAYVPAARRGAPGHPRAGRHRGHPVRRQDPARPLLRQRLGLVRRRGGLDTGECFGYVTGEFPEWGYFNLRQLETIGGRMWIVERDMHYTPRLFGAPSDLPLTVYGQPVR